MMTHFPNTLPSRATEKAPAPFASVRPTTLRDVLWGRPLFKAPVLANPRVALDPLPFTATRITRRPSQD